MEGSSLELFHRSIALRSRRDHDGDDDHDKRDIVSLASQMRLVRCFTNTWMLTVIP
jgi:hypothetical protein